MPLTLYAVQLAMNLAWSPIFFRKHELGWALADITGESTPILGTSCSAWLQPIKRNPPPD